MPSVGVMIHDLLCERASSQELTFRENWLTLIKGKNLRYGTPRITEICFKLH